MAEGPDCDFNVPPQEGSCTDGCAHRIQFAPRFGPGIVSPISTSNPGGLRYFHLVLPWAVPSRCCRFHDQCCGCNDSANSDGDCDISSCNKALADCLADCSWSSVVPGRKDCSGPDGYWGPKLIELIFILGVHGVATSHVSLPCAGRMRHPAVVFLS